VTAFARSALKAQGDYLQQPEKWLQDKGNLDALSRLSGVPAEQVPDLVKGNRYLPVDEQVTQLGQPVDKAIKDTAAFLKEQGKVQQVDDDYSDYVTNQFVKAVQASPKS
jgi:taurine transport system substrate-binding protein